MSDSDEDLMAESVHRLRNNIMNSVATNMNNTNITSFSFRSNAMTSMYKPTFKKQMNGMQRLDRGDNMCYRRETSPMSLKSFRDSRPQSFHNYPVGMSSNRSVFQGRSGSPMSMRSIDSNVSVSAMDIAQAFKYEKFNKYDLRLIKEAYNKFMKNRSRKRIEKRKNLKLFLKGHRRKPGDDDSGEQGSDSSISSDDCRSTRTFYNNKRSGPRSINTDITHFRSSIRDCDLYKDCTESFKQARLQNLIDPNNSNIIYEKHDTTLHQNQKRNSATTQKPSQQNFSNTTLKERFTKGTTSFVLPSQRFNKPGVNSSSVKSSINQQKEILNMEKNNKVNNKYIDSDSEKEEIFSEITIRENPQHSQQKRVLEDNEATCSDKKRHKTAPVCKQNELADLTQSDFNFKKPQMPARKSATNRKDAVPERIIAMSKPLPDSLDLDLSKKTIDNLEHTHSKLPVNSTEIEECSNQTEIAQNSTDVSMRPSFIKRKLFTQKLDVAENNNLSSDNVGTSSPHASLYSEAREKNKVRKLVTSQSCLSRDILCDDNMLDLIHKIVPPDQINVTTVSNKKDINKTDETDKWDVTSVISTCNIGDVSDTFTDEEIFKAPNNINKSKKNIKVVETVKEADRFLKNTPNKVPQCKVVVHKLPIANIKVIEREAEANRTCPSKKTVSSCIKSFWDTDFESDMDERIATPWKSRNIVGKEIEKSSNSKMNVNKRSNTKGTILTIRSLQNKTMNSSMKSDISRVSKKTVSQQNSNIITINSDNNIEQPTNKKSSNDTKNKKSKPKGSDRKLENENIQSKPVQTKNKTTKSQSSKNESTCNTSRESLRLKEKNEKKLNNTFSNDIKKQPRGRPRKSKENNDPLKVDNKKSKDTTIISNKGSNKNNNNNNVKNNNNKAGSNLIKKNNTINQTKLHTPQKKQVKNLFSTPISDSSFNISSRCLRARQRMNKY